MTKQHILNLIAKNEGTKEKYFALLDEDNQEVPLRQLFGPDFLIYMSLSSECMKLSATLDRITRGTIHDRINMLDTINEQLLKEYMILNKGGVK